MESKKNQKLEKMHEALNQLDIARSSLYDAIQLENGNAWKVNYQPSTEQNNSLLDLLDTDGEEWEKVMADEDHLRVFKSWIIMSCSNLLQNRKISLF